MTDVVLEPDFGELPAGRYVDARLDDADKRYQLRFEMSQRALDLALAASNIRLDSLNEWRLTYADLAARGMNRSEIETLIREVRANLEIEIKPLQTRVEQIGQTNWPLMGSFITIAFSMAAAFWLIIGLKIDAVNSPTRVSLETNRIATEQIDIRLHAAELSLTSSTQADGLSRGDRAQLNDRVRLVEGVSASNTSAQRAASGADAAKLVEIETQFKSLSDAFNTAADVDQQLQSIIYEAVFPGRHLPTRRFRPDLFSKQ